MKNFKLKSSFKTTKDQEKAVDSLVKSLKSDNKYQVLLGVTGSGKTFTVANVIQKLQKPALIISHNKTLAGQLFQELREFFPENAVSFFVSYYDYYQPEAYIPSTDTYIEKDADINELIDKLRLASTTNLLTRNDVIVVASVSCIYNIGSPKEYGNFIIEMKKGNRITRKTLVNKLLDLRYERAEFGFHRGTFRIRGDTIDVYPAYTDEGLRIEISGNSINSLNAINPITGELSNKRTIDRYVLYPAKHYVADPENNKDVFSVIRNDLKKQVGSLKRKGKILEAHRLKQRVNYDLEMIEEVGYIKGIENYSRYFDGRKPGEAPYTLLDYFNHPFGKDWLVIVDESHMTFPQIRGMYNGDLSRKKTLIEHGFRLPSAIDNRPLTFDEFMRRIPNFIATSATPGDWELNLSKVKGIKSPVEQLLRPTGIPDPQVTIKPAKKQVSDVIIEIKARAEKGQRTLVTTLTKRTAEDLAQYLKEKGINVHYLHSDIKMLDRTDILDDLRTGKYDCLVGINLLREGLDLPEVALVAILDADKEGFLRSDTALIQTMGRAARHAKGEVILYADNITGSMKRALSEVERRRKYQLKINRIMGITPKTIVKPIREKLVKQQKETELESLLLKDSFGYKGLEEIDKQSLTPMDVSKLTRKLKREMRIAAQDLNFELAAAIRDKISELVT